MDKKQWYKILGKEHKEINSVKDMIEEAVDIGKFIEDPLNFKLAQQWAKKYSNKKDIKITYGTKTKKFYVIDKSDRDWDSFSVFLAEFAKFKNEKDAIDVLTRARKI